MGHSCCLPSCPYRSRKQRRPPDISFHAFPSEELESERREAWLLSIMQNTGICLKIGTHSTLCSEHFRPWDFCYNSVNSRRLRKNVIPSVFPFFEDSSQTGYDQNLSPTTYLQNSELMMAGCSAMPSVAEVRPIQITPNSDDEEEGERSQDCYPTPISTPASPEIAATKENKNTPMFYQSVSVNVNGVLKTLMVPLEASPLASSSSSTKSPSKSPAARAGLTIVNSKAVNASIVPTSTQSGTVTQSGRLEGTTRIVGGQTKTSPQLSVSGPRMSSMAGPRVNGGTLNTTTKQVPPRGQAPMRGVRSGAPTFLLSSTPPAAIPPASKGTPLGSTLGSNFIFRPAAPSLSTTATSGNITLIPFNPLKGSLPATAVGPRSALPVKVPSGRTPVIPTSIPGVGNNGKLFLVQPTTAGSVDTPTSPAIMSTSTVGASSTMSLLKTSSGSHVLAFLPSYTSTLTSRTPIPPNYKVATIKGQGLTTTPVVPSPPAAPRQPLPPGAIAVPNLASIVNSTPQFVPRSPTIIGSPPVIGGRPPSGVGAKLQGGVYNVVNSVPAPSQATPEDLFKITSVFSLQPKSAGSLGGARVKVPFIENVRPPLGQRMTGQANPVNTVIIPVGPKSGMPKMTSTQSQTPQECNSSSSSTRSNSPSVVMSEKDQSLMDDAEQLLQRLDNLVKDMPTNKPAEVAESNFEVLAEWEMDDEMEEADESMSRSDTPSPTNAPDSQSSAIPTRIDKHKQDKNKVIIPMVPVSTPAERRNRTANNDDGPGHCDSIQESPDAWNDGPPLLVRATDIPTVVHGVDCEPPRLVSSTNTSPSSRRRSSFGAEASEPPKLSPAPGLPHQTMTTSSKMKRTRRKMPRKVKTWLKKYPSYTRCGVFLFRLPDDITSSVDLKTYKIPLIRPGKYRQYKFHKVNMYRLMKKKMKMKAWEARNVANKDTTSPSSPGAMKSILRAKSYANPMPHEPTNPTGQNKAASEIKAPVVAYKKIVVSNPAPSGTMVIGSKTVPYQKIAPVTPTPRHTPASDRVPTGVPANKQTTGASANPIQVVGPTNPVPGNSKFYLVKTSTGSFLVPMPENNSSGVLLKVPTTEGPSPQILIQPKESSKESPATPPELQKLTSTLPGSQLTLTSPVSRALAGTMLTSLTRPKSLLGHIGIKPTAATGANQFVVMPGCNVKLGRSDAPTVIMPSGITSKTAQTAICPVTLATNNPARQTVFSASTLANLSSASTSDTRSVTTTTTRSSSVSTTATRSSPAITAPTRSSPATIAATRSSSATTTTSSSSAAATPTRSSSRLSKAPAKGAPRIKPEPEDNYSYSSSSVDDTGPPSPKARRTEAEKSAQKVRIDELKARLKQQQAKVDELRKKRTEDKDTREVEPSSP